MKKLITVLLFVSSLVFGQNAWINELHYDNVSTDAGEFIEIAVQNPGSYTLSLFQVTLYNGSNGSVYGTKGLDEFTSGSTENGITLYYFAYPSNGIQNGSPDGISLDYNGSLIQFLSYEGSFAGVGGAADGITSTDIGVSENGTEAVGGSLGLTGTGTQYSDFTWTTFSDDTPGTPNGSQALPVELTTFSANIVEKSVSLNWETATEVNNYGFDLERKILNQVQNDNWEKIAFVEGHGNSNSPKYYSYSDKSLTTSGKYLYRLKQVDIDGTFEYSDAVEVNFGAPEDFVLNQNYPNPFNPTTSIQFTIPLDSRVRLSVFNVLGEEVAELVNQNFAAGYHSVDFNGSKLNSGIYFYKLEANNFMQIRKMMLVK